MLVVVKKSGAVKKITKRFDLQPQKRLAESQNFARGI